MQNNWEGGGFTELKDWGKMGGGEGFLRSEKVSGERQKNGWGGVFQDALKKNPILGGVL